MKQFICSILIVALLTSCSQKSQEHSFDLTETLKITADIPAFTNGQLSVYEVEWCEFDIDKMLRALDMNEYTEIIDTALGQQYLLEHSESYITSLIHYRNEDGVLCGGFYYRNKSFDKIDREESIIRHVSKCDVEKWSDLSCQILGNQQMKTFDSSGNISGVSQTDATQKIRDCLDIMGVENYQLDLIEVCDVNTMKYNTDIYNQYIDALHADGQYLEIEKIDTVFTDQDEFYRFSFSQLIDGIPLADELWMQNQNGTPSNAGFYIIHDSQGINEICIQNLVRVNRENTMVSSISPEEAIQIYVDDYSKSIHFDTTEIVDIALKYVVVMNSKVMYARPAWIITTNTTKSFLESHPIIDEYIERDYVAISADTGIILEKETDMR